MASLEDLTVPELLERAKTLESEKATFQRVMQDPSVRETFQGALKKLNPNLSIPEFDAKQSFRDEIKTEREARVKLENKILEDGIRADLEKKRAKVIKDYDLTEADLLEVEKIMTREVDPIPNYNAAAQVFKASKISATPTPASWQPPSTYQLMEGKTDPWAAGLMDNAPTGGGTKAKLDRIMMKQAGEAMAEIMGGKVPGLGSAKAN
jgi:hypothetical protein